MHFEFRMPQLGLSQDAGVIVAWLKGAGDSIARGETLLEVETDKATVELEAPVTGTIASIDAREGDEVSVGKVIALIAREKSATGKSTEEQHPDTSEPETPEPASVPKATEPPDDSVREATLPRSTRREAPFRALGSAQATPGQRVLASPKARRLAAERGIDLVALRAQGVREPIHVADLAVPVATGRSCLTANVEGRAFDMLIKNVNSSADRTRLFAMFSAGAWRSLFEVETVSIAIRSIGGNTDVVTVPDRDTSDGVDQVVLTMFDLCDTRIARYMPATGSPTLCIARGSEGFALTLTLEEAALSLSSACALLEEIAERIDDPIRQLL